MDSHNLKPYPAYKDSGVPWLGDVPEGWAVNRLRSTIDGCANGIWGAEPNGRNDLPCVRVADFDRNRLRVKLANPTMRAIDHNERKGRLLKRGDLLLEKSGGGDHQPVGVVVLYDHDEPAVCSNFIARMSVSANHDPGFLAYLHAYLYAIRANVRSIKQTIGIQNLDSAAYLTERGTLPPLPEQAAIVRYLDHVDRRIRRYIGAKQKLIKLLNEEKQAIIHRAVTRGLDPNVRLKPSGVEWLGDVPEGWDVRPAKYFYREIDERSTTGAEELLSVSHITGVTPRSQKNITMFKASSYVGHKLCRPGDLVINTMWAWMAALGVSRHAGIVSPSYATYRPLSPATFLDEYVDFLLRTRAYVSEYICRSTGIRLSRLRLYPEEFLRIRLVCPPIEEQEAILVFVSDETAAINRVLERTEREIALLHEYRTRLIADVVTGKLDVREAAVALPDEADVADTTEAIDELALGDESMAEEIEETLTGAEA